MTMGDWLVEKGLDAPRSNKPKASPYMIGKCIIPERRMHACRAEGPRA